MIKTLCACVRVLASVRLKPDQATTLLCRAILVAVSAFFISSSAMAQSAVGNSTSDKKLLWEEAFYTADGLTYTYELKRFSSEEAANSCNAMVFRCMTAQSADKQKFVQSNPELPAWLRAPINALRGVGFTAPIADPNGHDWVIIHVVNLTASVFPTPGTNPPEWIDKFAATSLPSAEELKTNPDLIMRRELNKIRSAEDLRRALEDNRIDAAHLDARLSNGGTLLIKAIYLKDQALIGALLSKGASPDKCGIAFCPLNTAVERKQADTVKLLLDNHANPDGSPEEVTPLISATGNRDLAGVLLSYGANPLLGHRVKIGNANVLNSVLGYIPPTDVPYLEWMQTVVDDTLRKTGKYEWSAWIEQGKMRKPVKDGVKIALKRAPFKFVMRMNPGSGFRIIASPDASIVDSFKDPKFHRDLLSWTQIGAADSSSTFLGVGTTAIMGGEMIFKGSTNEWGYLESPTESRGTKRRVVGGITEYVYDVNEIINAGEQSSIQQYKEQELSVIAGLIPSIGIGADYYKPVHFTLNFQ